MKTPNSIKDIVTGRSSLENWLKKNYEEFYEYLSNNYSWTNDYKAKVYCYYNNINEQPKCELCGKPTKFQSTGYGYARFCGTKCSRNSKTSQERYKQTNIERYGEDYKTKMYEKSVLTKIERYGSLNYNNLEKRKQTCLEKFGVDNPMKSKDVREKAKNTMLNRYGYECNFLDPDLRKRNREKPIHHYKDVIKVLDNGDFVCACPDLECNKCEEKQFIISYYNYYNRRFVFKTEVCTNKYPIGQLPTNNKDTNIEKFIKNILDDNNIEYITNTRRIVVPYELDIYIPSKKIAIECNGRYWHTVDQKGDVYHEDKYNKCREKGIRLISIWDDWIKLNPTMVESIILNSLNIKEEYIVESVGDNLFIKKNDIVINKLQKKDDSITVDNDICIDILIEEFKKQNVISKYILYTYNDVSYYKLYEKLNFEQIGNISNIWFYKNYDRFDTEVEGSFKIQDSGLTKWRYKNKQ